MLKDIESKLQKELPQHVRWRILVTKDTCYIGKVLKIIFTNHNTDGLQHDTSILDLRYSREQIIACIPLRLNPPTDDEDEENTENVEEFNDYLNLQLFLIIQAVNDTFGKDNNN